jgi:Phage-related protein
MHTFTYNGRTSDEFNLVISGEDTWKKATPDISRMQIPGRNGDLILSNHRYNNVDITYHAGIRRNFDQYYTACTNFLLSTPGYHRLEDSYHPDHFRMALLEKEITPKLDALNKSGSFDLTFSCMPQLYLKSGEQKQTFTRAGTITNPTLFDAKPLLRVYGTGVCTVGSFSVTITAASSYTDIDCEIEEAFKGSTSCNDKVQLSGNAFPALKSGGNGISMSGNISKVEITPRWYIL